MTNRPNPKPIGTATPMKKKTALKPTGSSAVDPTKRSGSVQTSQAQDRYTVKAGESMWSITKGRSSDKSNSSVAAGTKKMAAANKGTNPNPDKIKPGQVLKVKAPASKSTSANRKSANYSPGAESISNYKKNLQTGPNKGSQDAQKKRDAAVKSKQIRANQAAASKKK